MNTHPTAAGRVRLPGVLALCALLGTLSGCLAPREVLGPKVFVIRPEISVPKTDQRLAATVGIRGFEAPIQYDRRMVVLEPDFRIGARSNESWAEPPAAAVTRCITDALAAAGRFADVGNSFNMKRPDLELTGELRAFQENRTGKSPVAEVEVRMELRAARSPKAIWTGTLREAEPLAGDHGNALAVAMNAAVGRLALKAAQELSAVEYVPEDPNASLEQGKKQ